MPKNAVIASPFVPDAKKPIGKTASRPKINMADEVAATIRQLIDQVSQLDDPADNGKSNGQRVLLDMDVDGVRCLLLEPPPMDPDRHELVLSPREQEVARMVAKGYANKTIAAVLDISSWTVGTYIRRIFAKLGVGCRAAMVARMQEMSTVARVPK